MLGCLRDYLGFAEAPTGKSDVSLFLVPGILEKHVRRSQDLS